VTWFTAVLKIGAFAQQTAVSVKTLRIYGRAGVFRPAYVDMRLGYRHYETDQLALLRVLRLLRELGGSVADLWVWVELQNESADRVALLLSLRDRLQCQLSRDRERIRVIDQWIRDTASVSQSFRQTVPVIRSVPSAPALTIRDRVRAANPTVYNMFYAAERAVARQKARAAQRPFLLLHDGAYRNRNADV